ncbi:MAG: hypothetical protein LQ346_007211 [Caloplaca aetnensis]|nr:MAG: hypothetical protein LQ346_007211 [Caloplaca aetnensis]
MSEDVPLLKPFQSLQGKIDPALLAALKDMKFENMSPVQQKVMEMLPAVGSDCLVQAKTGTGKTIAFLLPAIQNALMNPTRKGLVSILVMSPTRELALQIAAEAKLLVSKLQPTFEVHTAFGGTARASNLSNFKKGDPKILIATPGRLNDYLSDEEVAPRFKSIRSLVLDEADRMLDQGFLPDILKILNVLPPKKSANWQGMCFSATIPPKMQEVFAHVLEPNHVKISTIDASEPPTLDKVPQFSVVVPSVKDTFTSLYLLLQEEIKATVGAPKIIVFGTTAKVVALCAELFRGELGLDVYELHSRLSQPARTKTTDIFKRAKKGILFASDVIGRGMDFPDVSLVVQVGLPSDADAYTHRVGRTARAGKDGRAVILLTEAESFYLIVNPQFPIKPYPASAKILELTRSPDLPVTAALRRVDPVSKDKAYSAYLGFMKTFMKQLKLDAAQLVQMANQFALEGMLCYELPKLEKKTVGKMGLKNTPGISYAEGTGHPRMNGRGGAPNYSMAQVSQSRGFTSQGRNSNKRPAPSAVSQEKEPSRRLRHQ